MIAVAGRSLRNHPPWCEQKSINDTISGQPHLCTTHSRRYAASGEYGPHREGIQHEAQGRKGKGRRGLARASCKSFGLIRHAIAEGWIVLEKEPLPGGNFVYLWFERDIRRLDEIVQDNMSWLRSHRPGLYRFLIDQAAAQGRRLPG